MALEDHEIRVPLVGEHYEHYKGGRYEVLAVGRLSEKRDRVMVVYRSLERGHTWIRPLGMWGEYLDIPGDAPGKPATRAQRFRLCADSPPATEIIPLTPEEAAELDRELTLPLPLVAGSAVEHLACQHLRAKTLAEHSLMRIATVRGADVNGVALRYHIEAALCLFCAVYAVAPIINLLKLEPVVCAPPSAPTTPASPPLSSAAPDTRSPR